MAEHVGGGDAADLRRDLYALLRPAGPAAQPRHLAQAPARLQRSRRLSFIDRYVFPDGELEPMATMIEALEGAGFEVRDVESLREHYALTLRAWVANLEAQLGRARGR